MQNESLTEIINELDEEEQKIFMQIVKAEKELLHKKALQGTSIKKDIYNFIKEGVK